MPKLAIVFLVASSVLVFAISLALPAFETNVKYLIENWIHEPSKSYLGIEILFLGWASIIFGGISWLANIGYFSALALIKLKSNLAFPISVAAFATSLLPLAHPLIWEEENGHYFYISHLNSGYYFWLGAISLMCIAALVRSKQRSHS